MQLTINLDNCKNPKEIAAHLRMKAGLFEGMTGKQAAAIANTEDTSATSAASTDDDNDFATKPAKGGKSGKNGKAAAKTAKFDDDGDADNTAPTDTTAAATTDDDNDFDFSGKPSTKGKKFTSDDVHDACKQRALRTGGKAGRNEVLAILEKKFKVESVSELKPEQYNAVVAAMEA